MRIHLCVAIALAGCGAAPRPTGAVATEDAGGTIAEDAGGARVAAGEDASAGAVTPSTDDAGTSDSADAGRATIDAGPAPPAAYLTTDDLTLALSPAAITLGDQGSADATVTVDPTTTYQSIVGFGASITDSSSYVMTKYLSASALQQVLTKLFDPIAGVGLSFLRQPMGASDFSSVGNFSYDGDSSDPTLAGFSIAQDAKATIPVLRQVLGINPRIFILGTPWSAPSWMKLNSSMDGSGGAAGNPGLSGSAYAPYGQYFVKFVQAYAAAGVTVGALTPQNEPLNGTANYPGMGFDAPSETSFVGQDLGPDLATAGLSTLIWAYDHNWDVESYPETVVNDATAGGFTEGAAFHCYAGDPSAMTTFHQNHPDKSVYMTECSGGTWQSDPFANTIDLAIGSTANWARAISLWNMALDENAGPQNDGCSTCRGVVTVNSQSGAVTYNADYYALGHFSRFVLPGAVRIGSSSSSNALSEVAFKNASGRAEVVAHNTGTSALKVRVGSGATAMNVTLPANAAVTVDWMP